MPKFTQLYKDTQLEESRAVTPTGLPQTIKPTNGYVAIKEVTVEGAVIPSGTISITDNGIYDVVQFANADVNVDNNPFIAPSDTDMIAFSTKENKGKIVKYVGETNEYENNRLYLIGEPTYIIPAQTLITFNDTIDVEKLYYCCEFLEKYPSQRGIVFVGCYEASSDKDTIIFRPTKLDTDGSGTILADYGTILSGGTAYSNGKWLSILTITEFLKTIFITENLSVSKKLYNWFIENALLEQLELFEIPAGMVVTFNDQIISDLPAKMSYLFHAEFVSNGSDYDCLRAVRQTSSGATKLVMSYGTTSKNNSITYTEVYNEIDGWANENYKTAEFTSDYSTFVKDVKQWFLENTDLKV